MKATPNLPVVIGATDYHYFDVIKEALNKAFKEKVKMKELGFDGNYYAVFYFQKLPSIKEQAWLLKEANYNFDFSPEDLPYAIYCEAKKQGWMIKE